MSNELTPAERDWVCHRCAVWIDQYELVLDRVDHYLCANCIPRSVK